MIDVNTTTLVELTDAELEAVCGGALLRIDVENVANRNNVNVEIPVDVRDVNVAVNAAVALLGAAGAVTGQR